MPSSTSSSDLAAEAEPAAEVRPGFVRLTASDRPGVAQPVPMRDIPPQPWNRIFVGAMLSAALLVAGAELYWRSYGATPSYRNSDGAWAAQRRRIDQGEGGKTVLIGSSRVLFDLQLPVWQKEAGQRPIQLALEGTSALPVLEDLADDPNFTGRLLVGVTPALFFSGRVMRGGVVKYFHREGLTQRTGQWLSSRLLEPFFAFDDPDFALATVVQRQPWPARPGAPSHIDVRKLSVSDADRNTHMWKKVEKDAEYRALARKIWTQTFAPPPPDASAPSPAEMQRIAGEQISRAAAAVTKLRARGAQVIFLRLPSAGPFLEFENRVTPRAQTWDVLLQRTGAPGIHFEDYPQLQGYTLPEWSHLAASEAERLTAALVPIVEAELRRHPVAAP
ncbi:MAG: hypothetical protein JWN44_2887 [Myxococcales bacterium]|nr:hypothetical protein [Myxococcales bacterium]